MLPTSVEQMSSATRSAGVIIPDSTVYVIVKHKLAMKTWHAANEAKVKNWA